MHRNLPQQPVSTPALACLWSTSVARHLCLADCVVDVALLTVLLLDGCPTCSHPLPKCQQVNLDFNDDDENRVLLLVHDTKPPFLQGQVVSGKATGVVLPLKDPTSDMAVIAR